MDWLKEHVGWFLAGALIVMAVLAKWGRTAFGIINTVWDISKKIEDRREHLLSITESDLDTYKQKCEELGAEVEALRRVLVDVTRQLDTRNEINAQDRGTIRLLKERLREHNIEYDDVEPIARSRQLKQ